MAVETNVITVGEEKDTDIVTTTTVKETMSAEKFLATFAQKEGQVKSLEQNLEVLNGMIKDIQTVKTSRDMKVVRELLDKMLRPDKLLEQKAGLEKNLKEIKVTIDNLKPLFEKAKARAAEANKDEQPKAE
jgi:bacterioferritin (cytochrome b1)